MRHIYKVGWILGFLLLTLSGKAQFTLDEIGISAGIGPSLLAGESATGIGMSANAKAYYSHYFCGKRHGFHVVAGARYLTASFDEPLLVGRVPDANESNSLSAAVVELGFFGKIRKNEYHRPKETALMVGPVVNLPFMGRYTDGTQSGSLSNSSANLAVFTAGIHASLQIRRKFDKNSWFIHPGIEYFPMSIINNTAQGDFRNAHFFLNFGINLWDAKG